MKERLFRVVSWSQPYATIDTNVNGTISVFEAVKKVRTEYDSTYDPMVVVACSSAEYGETLNKLQGEEVPSPNEWLKN